MDAITAVRYKGGDARLTDGSFATPESRQKLVDSLNRDFQTHTTAGDDVNPNYGCAGSILFIELSSGWTAGLTYYSPTNRLYDIEDGFYVDAPPELGPLLGIEPFSEGPCYVNPAKQQ